MTVSQQLAQQGTIRVLLDWASFDVRVKDVDGNTALHYLVGTLKVTEVTIEMVRRMDGAKEVSGMSENSSGVTPKMMWEDLVS